MQFGLFSPNVFDPFDRGYGFEHFNPWANGYQRPSFRPQSAGGGDLGSWKTPWANGYQRPAFRPQSAGGGDLGSWKTPFCDTPTSMHNQCEFPERKDYFTPRRGRKTRPKSAEVSGRKFQRPCRSCVQDVHDSVREEDDEQQPTQPIESEAPKKRNLQVTPPPELELSDLCMNDPSEDGQEEERMKQHEPNHDEEMTKCKEESFKDKELTQEPDAKKATEDEVVKEGTWRVVADAVNEDDKNDEQNIQEPEDEVPEQNTPEKKCIKDQESTTTECNEQNNEEKKEEIETPEDIERKKLEFIEQQITKAREIAPKEVVEKPIDTDKQRLYLTEMLLRCILNLDSIQAEGNETVKSARKNAVREIQSYLDHVENTTRT